MKDNANIANKVFDNPQQKLQQIRQSIDLLQRDIDEMKSSLAIFGKRLFNSTSKLTPSRLRSDYDAKRQRI